MTDIQRALADLSDAGWTWQEVADHVGVRVGTVNAWWSGARRPTYTALILTMLEELAEGDPPAPRRWNQGRRR